MTLREQIEIERREKAELQSALEAEVAAHNRLSRAVTKFLDGRMKDFNDSRVVDDDLVALASAVSQ